MSGLLVQALLDQQLAYYRARANEYDQYYDRTGPFDRGSEENAVWLAELSEAARALDLGGITGTVLDVAAGSGWWTERLATSARRVVAVDGAPEMLAVNRSRTAGFDNVELIEADLFAFEPDEQFDTIFFGFWLSHVPLALFDEFWERLRRWLAPGGDVRFVDNLESSAPQIQQRPGDGEEELMTRRLNDGRRFTIVKTVWTPRALHERLGGWEVAAATTSRFFVYGHAQSDPGGEL